MDQMAIPPMEIAAPTSNSLVQVRQPSLDQTSTCASGRRRKGGARHLQVVKSPVRRATSDEFERRARANQADGITQTHEPSVEIIRDQLALVLPQQFL